MGHDLGNRVGAAELNRPAVTEGRAPSGPSVAREAGVPVDELDLLRAVVGDRLILSECDHEPLRLHRVERGRATLFGSFEDAAAAWRALDDLDAPPRRT